MSLTIKIDCDGVLRDLLPQMCKVYNEHFNEHIEPENVLEYDLTNTFHKCMDIDGMTPNIWFFQEHILDIYVQSDACHKAKEAMDILHKKGYHIVIVSHQPKNWHQSATLLWLEINDIYYDSICFTNNKNMVLGDIIVDDNIEFLDICKNERKILIDAPYNRDNNKYEKFKNLFEFVKTL